MLRTRLTFFGIILLTIVAGLIALPQQLEVNQNIFGRQISFAFGSPKIDTRILGIPVRTNFELKQGLDIQGGVQLVLDADMSEIAEDDRETALESAQQIILRRVDLYGINEPVVQTSTAGDTYRLIVELAGITDSASALQLVGQTAELDFRLQGEIASDATASADILLSSFQETGLTGAELRRASVQFDQTTGQPTVLLEFNDEGKEQFASITRDNTGQILGIFIDGFPIMLPVIQTPILDGQATITGGFTLDEAQQLAIQLNAGALPVKISPVEQRTIGASLGQASVAASIRAGVIGIGLVMLFMILYYRIKGFLASLALLVYAVLTVAVYKVLGVTVTLPGIAGLLLSIGMAVDANILIFERMKEELRLGKPFERAMELGFGRAWDSIKDANLATIVTALVLINPLDFTFLNTSGLVRGFGLTLLVGVILGLFTGVVVTRTFMRLFLKG